MSNEVVAFLRQQANQNDYMVFNDIFGRFDFNSTKPIKQSSGAVYGIFAQSTVQISTTINLPDLENFYPVYWGRDIKPTSRIVAHFQNYNGTGNANLKGCIEIQDKLVIFGAIFVSNYKEFEKYLHISFPPLIPSTRAGRSSTLVEIEN